MGSALLPIWLMRGEPREAMQVAKAVAIVRVGLAAALLTGLVVMRSADPLFVTMTAVQAMLYGHLAFNFALWFLAPVLRPLASRMFATKDDETDAQAPGIVPTSDLAPAAFKREVNKMLDTLNAMLNTATADAPNVALVAQLELTMNNTLKAIRQSYADCPSIDENTDLQINTLLDYAIRIERSADLLSGKYMDIRHEQHNGLFQLSENANAELTAQTAELHAAMILAQHVFWKEDPTEARQLIERKAHMTQLEQNHKRQHFARLKSHDPNELASSNQYLEMIAALKEVTSKLATIGYVVLDRHGELKKSRLKAIST